MTQLATVKRVLPDSLRGGYDNVISLSRDECLRLWSALTGKAIEILRQRAQLVFRFQQEGWNVEELGNGHTHFYLCIASGQMLPELFVAVADPALLDKVHTLPIHDQWRVVRNEPVKVLVGFNESGQPYFQEMPLANMAPKYAATVFHGGKICDESEQVAVARSKARLRAEPRLGTLTPDPRRGGANSKIGNVTVFYPRAQLEAALSALEAKGNR